MPLVQETVKKFFGLSRTKRERTRSSRRRGDQAGVLKGDVRGVLLDVTPLTLGIETLVAWRRHPAQHDDSDERSQTFSTATTTRPGGDS